MLVVIPYFLYQITIYCHLEDGLCTCVHVYWTYLLTVVHICSISSLSCQWVLLSISSRLEFLFHFWKRDGQIWYMVTNALNARPVLDPCTSIELWTCTYLLRKHLMALKQCSYYSQTPDWVPLGSFMYLV